MGKAAKSKSNSFLAKLCEQTFTEDQQEDIIIIFDFLVQDYVFYHHKITGTELKSAISAYNLQDSEKFKQTTQQVIASLN